MVVVPTFAMTEQGTNEVVPGEVGDVVIAVPERVAYGVDRPGYVMDEKDPHEATPEKPQ